MLSRIATASPLTTEGQAFGRLWSRVQTTTSSLSRRLFARQIAKSSKRLLSSCTLPPAIQNKKADEPAGGWLSAARASNAPLPSVTKQAKTSYLSSQLNVVSTANAPVVMSHKAVEGENGLYLLHLSWSVARGPTPHVKPVSLVCAVDTSSSMADACTDGRTSDKEALKFNRMDLVQHSLRATVAALRPVDQISIVGFNDQSSVLLQPLAMDSAGKRQALAAIHELRPGGMTNLWDGLSTSLNIHSKLSQEPGNAHRNLATLLLTDGEPNVNPPGGIMSALVSKLTREKEASPSIHTFGYGYNLDSALMHQIAVRGGGLFAHIPDHTMCGSVFTHFLANTMAAAVGQLSVTPHITRGAKAIRSPSQDPFITTIGSKHTCYRMGAAQWDQPRELCLVLQDVEDPSEVDIDLLMECDGHFTVQKIRGLNVVSAAPDVLYEGLKELTLACAASGLTKPDLAKTTDILNTGFNIVKQCKYGSSDATTKKFDALARNIKSLDANEGQLIKAFSSDDWFTRWGNPYIRYFLRSHHLGARTNFKDPSLQVYGGLLFQQLLAEVEEIYAAMPVPKPSLSSVPFRGNFRQSFYDSTGPCFDGGGLVKVRDPEGYGQIEKYVSALKKGDVVINSAGYASTIECVVKTKVKGGHAWMVERNGVFITPWHPIRTSEHEWEFPANVGNPQLIKCPFVYNFVLNSKSQHVITINGIDAVTLGHGYRHSILKHDFLGTHKVIEHLASHPGWANGLVEIENYNPTFDSRQNLASFW